MASFELVRFLADSADELLKKAETMESGTAGNMVDEAEEMLVLGASILNRRQAIEVETKEAA